MTDPVWHPNIKTDGWWYGLPLLIPALTDEIRGWKGGVVPEPFLDMTIREWGQQVNATFDRNYYYDEETWT